MGNLYITAAAGTDAGRVRDNNEDNYYLCGQYREDPNVGHAEAVFGGAGRHVLVAVADGMGGEDHGEVASLCVVRHLRPSTIGQVREMAINSVRAANQEICRRIVENDGSRMGSTLAALYIDAGQAVCCNVGDSRVYHMRDGQLTQLSTDHNRAQQMVNIGVLTPEQAGHHPSRHELTQHLGIFEEEMVIEPAITEALALQPGDTFLLCSDGLTDMLTDAEIASVLAVGKSPEDEARELIRQALERGGKDNVTVVSVHVAEDQRSLLQRMFNL